MAMKRKFSKELLPRFELNKISLILVIYTILLFSSFVQIIETSDYLNENIPIDDLNTVKLVERLVSRRSLHDSRRLTNRNDRQYANLNNDFVRSKKPYDQKLKYKFNSKKQLTEDQKKYIDKAVSDQLINKLKNRYAVSARSRYARL